MWRWIILSVVSLLILALGVTYMASAGTPSAMRMARYESGPLLVTQVRIVDAEADRLSAPRDVLIEDGRITRIETPGLIDPANRRIVEGEGLYLMPGLIDTHVHVFDEADLAANLVQGVTTVRNMGGLPFHLSMERRIAEGRLLAPRFFTTGPITNERGGRNSDVLQHWVSGEEEARAEVRAQYERGFRHVKVYSNLSRESYTGILTEAERLGMQVSGHPVEGTQEEPMGFDATLMGRFTSIEHVESIIWHALDDDTDRDRARSLADEIAASGSTVSPTLVVHGNLARIVETEGGHITRPEMSVFNPVISHFEQDRWGFWAGYPHTDRTEMQAFYTEFTGFLHEAGVPLVVGSDAGVMVTPHGISAHDELVWLTHAGLSPAEALQAATTTPAHMLGLAGQIGRVSEGYRADLLLVEDNPLDDIYATRLVRAVIRDGIYLGPDERGRLHQAAERHNRLRTWRRLIWHVLTRTD